MLTSFLTSVLPGARALRPPLIAGALWAIFCWIAFGEHIPEPNEASGLAKRSYDLAAATGRVGVGLIVALLVFVLGMLAVPLAEAAARVVGFVGRKVRLWVDWQVHAQRGRRALQLEARNSRRAAEEAAQRLQNHADQHGLRKTAEQADDRLQEVLAKLAPVERRDWIRGWWIRRSDASISAVGAPAGDAGSGLELRMVFAARRAGMSAMLEKLERVVEVRDVEGYMLEPGTDSQLALRLGEDVASNPTDLLQALDDGLYQAVDREEAENEVRVAASVPLVAISLLVAVRWTPWALAAGGLALITFTRGALARSQLPSRVLKLAMTKGLMTPALREAELRGRDIAASYVVFLREREEAEKEARSLKALTTKEAGG